MALKLTSNRAHRFSTPKHHRDYGIYNWFVSNGLNNKAAMSQITEDWLTIKHFKSEFKNERLAGAKLKFIQNRFSEFATFARPKIKEHLNKAL